MWQPYDKGNRPSGLYITDNNGRVIVSRWTQMREVVESRVSVAVDVPPWEVDLDFEASRIEEVTTVGWWKGHRVSVSFLEGGGYLLQGRLRVSDADPVGASHIDEQARQFLAEVTTLKAISGLMSTVDRVLPDGAATPYDVGAHVDLKGGRRALLVESHLVVSDDTGAAGAYQGVDGTLYMRDDVERLIWWRAFARWGRDPVEVWAVVGDDAFVLRAPVPRGKGVPVLSATDGQVSALTGIWVPLMHLSFSFLYERSWSTSVPLSLPQGLYAKRSISESDPRRGARGKASSLTRDSPTYRHPSVDPILHVWDDEQWKGSDLARVETTASFQGLAVTLVYPYNAWQSWDEALVTGHGKAPAAWTMDDGHVVVCDHGIEGKWMAVVRVDDLRDVSTRFV